MTVAALLLPHRPAPSLASVRQRLTGLATRARLPELLLIAGRLSC